MNWLIKFLMFHLVKKLNFYYLIGTDEAGQGSLFSISDPWNTILANTAQHPSKAQIIF